MEKQIWYGLSNEFDGTYGVEFFYDKECAEAFEDIYGLGFGGSCVDKIETIKTKEQFTEELREWLAEATGTDVSQLPFQHLVTLAKEVRR